MKYYVGQSAEFAKTISESDVYTFAGVSGDFNPVHINAEAARKTVFKERIVHGALTASLISTVLGNKLPGEGTIYLEQNSKFVKPVKIGDTITAVVTITEINGNKALLDTIVYNQNKECVLEGTARVMLPEKRYDECV